VKQQQKKTYITLKDGGCDFRKMARIMTAAGYKMNHATARNQLILAIESLISHTSSNLKVKISKAQLRELITNQALQDNLADVLFTANEALKREEHERKQDQKRQSQLRPKQARLRNDS